MIRPQPSNRATLSQPVPTAVNEASGRRAASPPAVAAGKIAVTVRLDPARVRQLQAAAAAENRTLTNYVETALIRDLARRDEAPRIVSVLAAEGTSGRLDPAGVVRADDETDGAFARRSALLAELWSIPDDA